MPPRGSRMILIEESCSLCGVTHRYSSLYRCYMCRRLYCRACFLYDEEGNVICLECAKRRVSPRVSQGKYTSLSVYLARRAKYTSRVALPFSKIEEIIGDRLPFSAFHYEHWWSNARNRSPSEAWMTVGWSVQAVDLEGKIVVLKKDKPTDTKAPGKVRRRKPVSAAFRALASKRKRRKPSGPSKTRVAQVQARLRNIGRREASVKAYEGKLKPRSAYEKRLYKPDEKPD